MSTTLKPTPSPTEATIRTPLGRVRGLGSAKEGADHFWKQRVTAVSNIVLIGASVFVVLHIAGADHATALATLKKPLVGILLLLLILSGIFHMRLGMQTVIEDYVHREGPKVVFLMLNTFFSIFVGLTCVYAVLKLGFSA